MSDSPKQPPDKGGKPETRRRFLRLEELRRDLYYNKEAARRVYALDALLALLWVEAGKARLAVACVLCGYPPQVGKADTPPCADRLCVQLKPSPFQTDLPPPPPVAERIAWAGQAVAAVLTEALNTLKAMGRRPTQPGAEPVEREVEVCRDALRAARILQAEAVAEPCARLLRLFPPELTRDAGPIARHTTALREAACHTLGTLSPDALFYFWQMLGGADSRARHDLLPALDYLHDARAVPHLLRLLERRIRWEDGEIVGWFVVRAFERLEDRRALPALRRIATSDGPNTLRQSLVWLRKEVDLASVTSPELAREARRVIEAIEQNRSARDRNSLLRPAEFAPDELLRPAADPPDANDALNREELLRPEE